MSGTHADEGVQAQLTISPEMRHELAIVGAHRYDESSPH